jgi:hypothetical protein
MSSVVTVFDPATNPSEQFIAPNGAANGALVFFNESNNSLILTFADGSTMYLPAWYHRHKCGTSGSVQVTWGIHVTLSSAAPPISQVIVESFAQGEAFPADGPLMRQANVGNQLPLSSSTQAVINDGNPTGTTVVESTVAGDSGSAMKMTNDAIVVIGNATHAGSLTVVGPATLNSTNFPTGTPGNETHLVNTQGSDIVLQSPAGTEIGRFTNGGNLKVATALQLLTGLLSHISFFGPLSVTTTTATFSHGLGVVPDIVLIQVHGGVSTTRTCAVNYNTLTTTGMDLTGNGSFSVYGVALKLS